MSGTILALALLAAPLQEDYFPLTQGMRWTYETGAGKPFVKRVLGLRSASLRSAPLRSAPLRSARLRLARRRLPQVLLNGLQADTRFQQMGRVGMAQCV